MFLISANNRFHSFIHSFIHSLLSSSTFIHNKEVASLLSTCFTGNLSSERFASDLSLLKATPYDVKRAVLAVRTNY